MSGKIIVCSGPSGTGKGSICSELLKKDDYAFSVSFTTRAPRNGEVEGKSYHFVSQEEFDKTVEEGGFLEYVQKYGNSYGTPKKQILDKIADGTNILLDIEMKGALNIKKVCPEAILIFVLPPSLKALHDRLLGRKSESPEQIEIRQKEIQKEIAQIGKYDYYVVNEDIAASAAAVERIVRGCGEEYRVTEPQKLIDRYKEE